MKNENDQDRNKTENRQNTSFEKFKSDTRRVYHDLYQSDPPRLRENQSSRVQQSGQSHTRAW